MLPAPSTSWSRLALVAGALVISLSATAAARITRSVDGSGVVTLGNQGRAARSASAPSADAPPMTAAGRARFDTTIRQASALYRIPEALIAAVIAVESGFNPAAVSRTNAQGLMQLMPATAARMQVEDPFDPRQNILGGVRYLRVLANTFNGDLMLTLAAYNAGEGAVLRYAGVPPYAETRDYVTKVTALYREYQLRPE